MEYRVRISPRAGKDARKLYERLVRASPTHGQRWYTGLIVKIETLRTFPHRCPVVLDRESSAEPIRQLEYGRKPHIYRIYFRIRDEVVEVLAIRHHARRPLR